MRQGYFRELLHFYCFCCVILLLSLCTFWLVYMICISMSLHIIHCITMIKRNAALIKLYHHYRYSYVLGFKTPQYHCPLRCNFSQQSRNYAHPSMINIEQLLNVLKYSTMLEFWFKLSKRSVSFNNFPCH